MAIIPQKTAPKASTQYAVSGRVYAPRAGVGGLTVEVFDKRVGPDVLLAKATTDSNGTYSVQYPLAPVLRAGKNAPDIQIRVLAGTTTVATSEVRYNASAAEILNVTIPDSAASALPSEYESLTGAIGQFYKGKLGDLQESGPRSDVTYLGNKTGWDARAVALAALADQFSQRSQGKIAPPFFYALFRGGAPANDDALYRLGTATVTGIWQQAGAQGVIPASLAQGIPDVIREFQALSAARLLTGPALAGPSTFADLLGAAGLVNEQSQVAGLYVSHSGDNAGFWEAVAGQLGPETTARLQAIGKLAFLTINNAPLIQKLTETDLLALVQAGYHRASKWSALLDDSVPVPQEIPGDTPAATRANYAEYLAAQLRIAYPTAAVAELVQSGDLPVDVPNQVHAFLTANQGKYEMGVQPVAQYIARNQVTLDDQTAAQIQRIERVYQITTTDAAMSALLKRKLDAAYHIVQYDRQAFVGAFAAELGGTGEALNIYNKAVQIHGTVLNVAVSYLTASNGIPLGGAPMMLRTPPGGSSGQVLRPAPTVPPDSAASGVIAYPTLEKLFGSMDFCSCDECRSILSPAAYLVDLLHFLDKSPSDRSKKPVDVLLDRRPDLAHLPLTCENTNTAMPYIDVVNETLEYFVANTAPPLSLENFQGHDTNGAVSDDLLAAPQFVSDAAYGKLQTQYFPLLLPFHQPLETLRRYLNNFNTPLPSVMEALRQTDKLDAVPPYFYGWRDILMEQVGLSRQEYRLFTVTDAKAGLAEVYGFDPSKTDIDVIAQISNAKTYANRLDISYDDLVSILRTHFINPNSDLIPKLEKLHVSFTAISALHDAAKAGTPDKDKFLALLPTGAGAPDPAEYPPDIVSWLLGDNYPRIMGIITLVDPTGAILGCTFGNMELRYSQPVKDPSDTSTRLGASEFLRLLRFIRLWKKTGWTIEQTDKVVCALYRADLAPISPDDLKDLDTGFSTLLPRVGVLLRVMDELNLQPDRDIPSLLACWSDIGTHGDHSLYRELFLNPAMAAQDPVFADNGYGEYLAGGGPLSGHAEAVRGACHLTADEYDRICAALHFTDSTPLTIGAVSAIYRRAWLARKLRLSVREFLFWSSLGGLDPFSGPDIGDDGRLPPILRLIAIIDALRARGLSSAVALYVFWNEDLSGKSAPDNAQVTAFALTLRADFAAIDEQFAAAEDPNRDVLRARMELVYGQQTSDAFFALLDNTIALDAPYTQPGSALDPSIRAVDPALSYDGFRHLLSKTGLVNAALRDELKGLAVAKPDFQNAIDALYSRSQDALTSFFSRYPELRKPFDDYVASPDPPDKKRTALLAAFQPGLAATRKRQQAVQRLSGAGSVDLVATRALLDPGAPPYPLHAAGDRTQPVLNDFIAIQTPGLEAEFFFKETATGAADTPPQITANLEYSAPGTPLPGGGALISGRWDGSVELPENGYYNFVIEADPGATVRLQFGGIDQPLVQNGGVWRNSAPLSPSAPPTTDPLGAGKLYGFTVTVEKVRNVVRIGWETPKRGRASIPGRNLYPPSVLTPFQDAYTRFLKAASLETGLKLTSNEFAWLATNLDSSLVKDNWLNALAVNDAPDPSVAAGLVAILEGLLDFARMKSELSDDRERLLATLQTQSVGTLLGLTRWDRASFDYLLSYFKKTPADLADFQFLRRMYAAFSPLQAIGIPANSLASVATNDPSAGAVRQFQAALRARYDTQDWRDLIKSINDGMRSLQRDALVAYILQKMKDDPGKSQIDTPDKLFEYFLMDVEMEPCMQTSRIRHALSSVQLFVERCLMNLEQPDVAPDSIDADTWKWMKRYRVWQANREVFLFPENWLEPELRDDKSPIFKEAESELLQKDITEDSAATAYLNYLAKLAEIAKLQSCGMYREQDNGTVHVVARTPGVHRKYYYRRLKKGVWTNWEVIQLDIEDNPVIPVVWNNHLLLFWLNIHSEQVPSIPAPVRGSDPLLTEQHMSGIRQDAKNTADNTPVSVNARLCFSEYCNGKWQSAITSDTPTQLTLFWASNADGFSRDSLRLASHEGEDGLIVSVDAVVKEFLVYTNRSAPLPLDKLDGRLQWRLLDYYPSIFRVTHHDETLYPPYREVYLDLLKTAGPVHAVQPEWILSRPWEAPFIYEDPNAVFYVTSQEVTRQVGDFDGLAYVPGPAISGDVTIPPLALESPPPAKPRWAGGAGSDPGFGDPALMSRFVSEDAYIHRAIAATAPVDYGGIKIAPTGSISNSAEGK